MKRKVGIWGGNSGNSNPDLMWHLNPDYVMCLEKDMPANKIAEGKQNNPNTQIVIRFLHPTNWLSNIEESAQTQANRIIEKYPSIRGLDPFIIIGNELNLHYECGDQNPNNQWKYQTKEHYQRIYRWVELVASAVLEVYPDAKLLPPPMAFGHNEDGEPDDNGNPKIGWAGYDYLAPLLPKYFNNVMTAHYYWGHSYGSEPQKELYDDLNNAWYAFRWKRVLRLFETRHNNKNVKILIDEAGNFDAGSPTFKDEVKFYLNHTLINTNILGVIFFLWEDTTNSPGNLPNSWLQNISNISEFVEDLRNFYVEVDDEENPPPPPNQGDNNMLFKSFEESKDVLDESLHYHQVDSTGKVIGSVARIISVEEAQRHWDPNNMPKPGDYYWKVIRATLINEEQSRGDINIGVSYIDENGAPYAGAMAWFAYPTSSLYKTNWVGAFDNGATHNGDVFTYIPGTGQIAQGKNDFAPAIGSEEIGPYAVGAAGLYSEVIAGFGLPGNRHVSYAVTFQRTRYNGEDTTDPQPPQPPEPPQQGTDCECKSLLGQWLISLVKKYFC